MSDEYDIEERHVPVSKLTVIPVDQASLDDLRFAVHCCEQMIADEALGLRDFGDSSEYLHGRLAAYKRQIARLEGH